MPLKNLWFEHWTNFSLNPPGGVSPLAQSCCVCLPTTEATQGGAAACKVSFRDPSAIPPPSLTLVLMTKNPVGIWMRREGGVCGGVCGGILAISQTVSLNTCSTFESKLAKRWKQPKWKWAVWCSYKVELVKGHLRGWRPHSSSKQGEEEEGPTARELLVNISQLLLETFHRYC